MSETEVSIIDLYVELRYSFVGMVETNKTTRFYRDVGRRVRKFRERRQMTQAQLASAISLTRTSITNIEQGNQKLPLHKLAEIAITLGVDSNSLIPAQISDNAEGLESTIRGQLSDRELDHVRSVLGSLRRTK